MLRAAMFRSDPEVIHERVIRLLAGPGSWGWAQALLRALLRPAAAPVEVAGIRFPSPVGLAAGLDKDGLACRAWAGLGFGFAELGTVTAHAQPGNPKPRIFRAVASEGLINRMGFNNAGAQELTRTLARAGVYRGNLATGIPLGVSIGKTKAVPVDEAVPDYLASLAAVAPHADYVAVNVSSPNTPNLRSLQGSDALTELTQALTAKAAALAVAANTTPIPVFVKVAPDLEPAQLDEVLAACEAAGISGIIAVNTTLRRDHLAPVDQHLAAEAGGLSGRPLTSRALEITRYVAAHTALPVISSGGVMTSDDAKALFDAGAALVQLYTGFIYAGPALAMRITADRRKSS